MRCKRSGRLCALAGAFFAAIFPDVSGAQTPAASYAIQLGAFPAEPAAAALIDQLGATTAPVYLRQDSASPATPYKVCVGPFSTYMDAWVVRSVLPAGFPLGFIAALPPAGSGTAPSFTGTSDADLFAELQVSTVQSSATDPVSFVSMTVPEESVVLTPQLLEKPTEQMSRSELLGVGVKTQQNDKGTSALDRFLDEYSDDSARKAARLRLARRLMQKKDFAGARTELSELEAEGTAQEKRKARMIRAYLTSSENGSRAGYQAFKALADDAALPADLRSHAMRQAAGRAHTAREYTTAVLAYNQIIRQAPSVEERLEARLQRCAAMFELASRGKSKWPEVIAECAALKAEQSAPEFARAGAGLMEFEAQRFSDNFDESYALGKTYLQQWGENPKAYESNKMRQYINTARLFQMQNAYVTGHCDEALAMAQGVVSDPPAAAEHFAHGNTFLYACVIGHLCAGAQQAQEFETRGREFNDAYFSMLLQSLQDLKAAHTSN